MKYDLEQGTDRARGFGTGSFAPIYGLGDVDGNGADNQVAPSAGGPAVTRYTRYQDCPVDWQTRLVGIGGASAVGLLLAACALLSWQAVGPRLVSHSAPFAMEMLPLAAPPEPVHDIATGPQQAEQQEALPTPKTETPVPLPPARLPAISPAARQAEPSQPVVDPGPRIPETTAPKSVAAPVAPRLASDARPSWEAQLLAHLQRYRRFPARARAARQEGTVYVEFRMDRVGSVLSASVRKSSGFPTLDMAALDTLKRAQPLPAIPDDRPNVLELTIPIEYYFGSR